LARAVEAVPMAESDRSTCDVLVTDEYQVHEGAIRVPSKPGLAIGINEDVYRDKCARNEIVVS
jgi:hypothetical protein